MKEYNHKLIQRIESEVIEFWGGITTMSPYTIFGVKAKKSLHNGCHGFVAYFLNNSIELEGVDKV